LTQGDSVGDRDEVSMIYPPYIIERSSRGERTYDIFSRLLMDRIIFLGVPINDDVSNIVIAQLLFLQADSPEKDIYVYLNSPVAWSPAAWRSTTPCSTSARR